MRAREFAYTPTVDANLGISSADVEAMYNWWTIFARIIALSGVFSQV